ncbi:MAG: hypothetical protein PHS53_04655 [Candidatus Pacebacteria bacterium]|nr:hypothetical protein [Candidatus Paceibacterota bacterium]MDD5357409.1 hypothetical protein [Candidatus Paceibacterota bacterium]
MNINGRSFWHEHRQELLEIALAVTIFLASLYQLVWRKGGILLYTPLALSFVYLLAVLHAIFGNILFHRQECKTEQKSKPPP